MLSILTPHLHGFSHNPSSVLAATAKASLPKWDALSLPILSTLSTSLKSLALTRLSQIGARSFALLLDTLAEEESSPMITLESLEMHFIWLDDPLCEKVVRALGKKLKRLKFGTHGTKLTDSGVVTLLEGLEILQAFELSDVQGQHDFGCRWRDVAHVVRTQGGFRSLSGANCPPSRYLQLSAE